ncbi:MAG: methionyl-tRNA formyltransferase [Lentisphaerae bacterium RIFOXYC12_FULL_60_16]|nr:MAG: methionyl-tRNA formyltransferase [Lentisphaerae bacterium RIFOXYC12_FULL_60_16]OGV86242.1 MAG: methionyl-tRNA formyltransferase [Lentisphaerae bacterium RIFOXYB12_FULL_60_10]
MRIVFMGSAALACPCLEMLAESRDVLVAAVTQPDRPKGRNLALQPCPLKLCARRLGLPVLTPESINTGESVAAVQGFAPDLVVVVAYGQLLKPRVLGIPLHGCVNVHASLLPRYRGAAPIQWTLVNGDSETGVTTMFMDAGMDTGDIIHQQRVAIREGETAGELHDRLAVAGADLLRRTLESIRAGSAPRLVQDSAQATGAPKLRKEDGRMQWTRTAVRLYHEINGFNPWPGSFCEAPAGSGRRLRVIRATVEDASGYIGTPGTVVQPEGEGPLVMTGNGGLRLLEVQPEGRTRMTGRDYVHGHGVHAGTCLG